MVFLSDKIAWCLISLVSTIFSKIYKEITEVSEIRTLSSQCPFHYQSLSSVNRKSKVCPKFRSMDLFVIVQFYINSSQAFALSMFT